MCMLTTSVYLLLTFVFLIMSAVMSRKSGFWYFRYGIEYETEGVK